MQVFNILIAILRSKAIAIFLGPAGMGVVSILTNTLGLITALTSFGIGTSAIKNIATAAASNDEIKLSKTASVFRRLVWITGCLGFVLTLVLAPWLSKIAFGDTSYSTSFMILSLTLLFMQISVGQNVILQGLRKIKHLAKANMIGSLIGLIISLPLYYIWSEKGIVPAIILTSISTLFLSWFYASKVKILKIQIDRVTLKKEGKEMLRMGILISVSSLLTIGASYILRIFISNYGSLEDVGLYSAGFAIIATYVGMVFKAMGTDYYPRLTMIAAENKKCQHEINQQADIAVLILAPILVVFLVFIKPGIIALYSQQFLGIIDMLHWATLGIFFQALSWSLGYVLLAKGASKVFFWSELVSSIYLLCLNIVGYYYWGLTGLGISFLAAYFLHLIQMLIICKKLYGIFLEKSTWRISITQLVIAICCFIANIYLSEGVFYFIGCGFIIFSSIYSWKQLNKRMPISQIINNKWDKFMSIKKEI